MKVLAFIAILLGVFTLIFLVFYNTKNNITVNTPNKVVTTAQQSNTTIINSVPTTTPIPTPTKLTLDYIFNNSIEEQEQDVVIAATGDFIPARSVNALSVQKNDYLWTVENTAQLFSKADVVLVNLETPLIQNCPITNKGFKFCGSLKHIEAIKAINTGVINLANNHSYNYGEDGIKQTKEILDKNNIKYSGIYGENAFLTVKDIKFAFLGYNVIGANPFPVKAGEKELIKADIKEAKKSSDFVIVSFSWGDEYTTNVNTQQKELAHFSIDSGADLIIGNHPHTVQPVEIYKNKLITYAHGNYVFDQMWSEETKKGVIGLYKFNKQGLVQADFKPVYIQNYGESVIPTKKVGDEIINNLQSISYSFVYSN